jgi:hypothetical protein
MQRDGTLSFLGLLHGQQALFDASSRHAHGGEMANAPASHWLYIARRMRFTRLQKLHFKLALQVRSLISSVSLAVALQLCMLFMT